MNENGEKVLLDSGEKQITIDNSTEGGIIITFLFQYA